MDNNENQFTDLNQEQALPKPKSTRPWIATLFALFIIIAILALGFFYYTKISSVEEIGPVRELSKEDMIELANSAVISVNLLPGPDTSEVQLKDGSYEYRDSSCGSLPCHFRLNRQWEFFDVNHDGLIDLLILSSNWTGGNKSDNAVEVFLNAGDFLKHIGRMEIGTVPSYEKLEFDNGQIKLTYYTAYQGASGWSDLWTEIYEVSDGQLRRALDQFPDWQTYRNEEYGFEFKYPADQVKSIEVADSDEFYQDATQPSFSIITTSGTPHIFNLKTSDGEIFSALGGEEININNFDLSVKKSCATAFCPDSFTGGFDYLLFDSRNNKLAHFLFKGEGPLGHPTVTEFEIILSTFRFIDKDGTVESLQNEAIKFLSPKLGDIWTMGKSHDIVLSQSIPDEFNISRTLSLINEGGKEIGRISCAKAGGFKELTWDTYLLRNFCGAAAYGSTGTVPRAGSYKIRLSEPPNHDIESDFFQIVYPDESPIIIYPDHGNVEIVRQSSAWKPHFFFSWIFNHLVATKVDVWLRNVSCNPELVCPDFFLTDGSTNNILWEIPDTFPLDTPYVLEISGQKEDDVVTVRSKTTYILSNKEFRG